MTHNHRVKLENFCTFFDENLKKKYEPEGLRGIRLRFQALMNSLYDSLRISIELHSILEARFVVCSQTELYDLSMYLPFKQKGSDKEK